MLNEGRITVDEAVMLLEALGEKNALETAKTHQKEQKKGEVDDKASRLIEDFGKKINSFIENLGQYVQDGLGKVGEVSNNFSGNFERGFGGRRNRFEETKTGKIRDGSSIIIKSNGPVVIQGIDSPDNEFRLELIKMIRVEDDKKAELIANQALEIEIKESQIELNVLDKRELWLETILYLPRNFQYQIEVQSVNGKLVLSDLDLMKVRLETVNGRVSIEKCDALNLELKTLNGSIDIAGGFNLLDASTQNGSIDYYCINGKTKATIKSTNGSVRVRMPISQSIDYNIEASTGWGKINIDLPIKDLKLHRDGDNFVQATTAESNNLDEKHQSVQLKAFTNNGSITVLPLD